ncbi:hypothetical protein B9Z55_024486 [Caenorhabditis nigoni]|uniref:Uncharacterized protein n=1 Tax=Caenorhabditis nigoni TaxID=1611254 RepID=A0A2G5SU59_9PELO|nr:hypothetical protein B9Z55_024486 [Caenorhabditis nigoni]
MVLEQNEIDSVGETNAQVNDNDVFHLAFQMVYNYNKGLPRKLQDENHVRLIHPSFFTLLLENGMSEKLPEMPAFETEEPCSRLLVPFLRGNHFALVRVGKLEETYHMNVFDSLRPIHPNSSPFISDCELKKLTLRKNMRVRKPQRKATIAESVQLKTYSPAFKVRDYQQIRLFMNIGKFVTK